MPCDFRPLDEVGDDQKVSGVVHSADDIQLECEALIIFLLGEPGGHSRCRQTILQSFDGAFVQLCAFVGLAIADREARQHRRPRFGTPRTALRDLDRGSQCFGQIGEQLPHFRTSLEAVLGRKLPPVGFGNDAALGNREKASCAS
jgi:hypothetical protein